MTTVEMAKGPRKRERIMRPGSWVAAVRAETKIGSQMELGILIGRDKSAVTRWEGAEGEIDYVSWLGILAALGLPSTWKPNDGVPPDYKPPPIVVPSKS